MKFLFLVWGNLQRKKLRTVLTLLSILVAFVLFAVMSSINQALTGGVSMEGASHLITQHKVSIIQTLPYSYKARMLKIPGVDLVADQTWFGGKFEGEPKYWFMQCPVEPEEFLSMFPDFILPPEQKQKWLETRTGAILGRTTAEKFHKKIGDKIQIYTPLWRKTDGSQTWDFDIVGIFDGKTKNSDTMSLFFRYDYFDEAHGGQKGRVHWYTIRVKDPAQSAQIAKQVDEEFLNSDYETKTAPEAAFAQAWAKQIGNIALMCSAILGAVFFTILLVTGNTMAQSVRERSGEIGVLKALGFTGTGILALVMAESCFLALLGGALGLGLAALIVPVVGKALSRILPMFYFPARDVFVAIGICVALGLLSGIFPALVAMRLRVANALRKMA